MTSKCLNARFDDIGDKFCENIFIPFCKGITERIFDLTVLRFNKYYKEIKKQIKQEVKMNYLENNISYMSGKISGDLVALGMNLGFAFPIIYHALK